MELEHLAKLIVEFYEKLSSWENAVVRGSGLTTPQAHTIEIVGHAGAIKMKDLAKKIGVTTGTLTVGIDRLEKKNLLQRRPHDTDRRSYLIELTPEGQRCFEEHHAAHVNMTRDILEGLDKEEQEYFARILEKMMDRM